MTLAKNKTYPFPITGITIGTWTTLALLIMGLPFLFDNKEDITIWLNNLHHPILDQFFYYITFLGDGLFFIPIFLMLIFRNYVLGASFAVFVGLEALIVQLVLKKGFFAHLNRPPAYIENFDQLYQVPGIELHSMHTFPSGHTQSAFLIAFFLILLFQNYKSLQIIIPIIAALVGISRVYLLQHFFIDIWFGALIGFAIPYFTLWILQKASRFPSSNSGLIHLFRSI